MEVLDKDPCPGESETTRLRVLACTGTSAISRQASRYTSPTLPAPVSGLNGRALQGRSWFQLETYLLNLKLRTSVSQRDARTKRTISTLTDGCTTDSALKSKSLGFSLLRVASH